VAAVSNDRRTFPRLEVDACLTGDVIDRTHPIIGLRDLAMNGFSVESTRACVVGSRYQFRFATEGGLAVRLRAEAVYCRPTDDNHGTTFVNGFKFVADSPEAVAAIDLLMDSATAPLSFD
jgi:PilZ domain